MDINSLPANLQSVKNAASWMRQQFCIPKNQEIYNEFEKEFDCKLVWTPKVGYTEWRTCTVVFNSGESMLLFLLRWEN